MAGCLIIFIAQMDILSVAKVDDSRAHLSGHIRHPQLGSQLTLEWLAYSEHVAQPIF